MLFEVKIARFPVVFINSENYLVDYQVFTKTSKTRIFSINRFIFQKDARILASF
jgi:hypothetical protein